MEEGYLVLNLPPPPKLNVVPPLSCTDIVQIYLVVVSNCGRERGDIG